MPPVKSGSLFWTNLRGMNIADNPSELPDFIGTDAVDVVLEEGSLGRRRANLETISLSSGPSAWNTIVKVARHQSGTATAELWVFGQQTGQNGGAYRWPSGSWSSVTLTDCDQGLSHLQAVGNVSTASFNGKFFLAYPSSVNRLHLWDGSSVRRVGIVASSAATVANGGGAGAYPATIRYYKIQFKILSGSDIVAQSELSASVSFTPSGADTNATVTKPTTPDSATHWVVFASADNVTYFNLSGDIVVATTTYADTTTVGTYTGALAPTAGQFYPPPSCKFVLAADNRLFMAGAHESSAGTGLVTPKHSRIWYTPVLGASDIGDDERIVNSSGLGIKTWVDVGEHDGSDITGLEGPIDGIIYVLKAKAIWRLVPTGNVDAPYRPERITDQVGMDSASTCCIGEDGNGNPAIYFSDRRGPYRLVPSVGLEWLGADLVQPASIVNPFTSGSAGVNAAWDPIQRAAYFIPVLDATTLATIPIGQAKFQPKFERRTPSGVRDGWVRLKMYFGASTAQINAIGLSEVTISGGLIFGTNQTQLGLILGGFNDSGAALLGSMTGNDIQDMGNSTAFAPSVTSKRFLLGNRGLNLFTTGQPIIELDRVSSASVTVPTVSVLSDVTGITGSATEAAALSRSGTPVGMPAAGSYSALPVESLSQTDLWSVKFKVAWYTDVSGSSPLTGRDSVYSLRVPFEVTETVGGL